MTKEQIFDRYVRFVHRSNNQIEKLTTIWDIAYELDRNETDPEIADRLHEIRVAAEGIQDYIMKKAESFKRVR